MSKTNQNSPSEEYYVSSKPWTRWWWFSGEIREEDISFQLDWIKQNGFGGVEIAWVYPLPDSIPGPKWLSSELSEKIVYAKQLCEKLGLGCDFTFGTMWPFGGSFVSGEDASHVFGGLSKQRLRNSWETLFTKEPGYILNHLDRKALERYSVKMGDLLKCALKVPKSALFCDSWEIETEVLTTGGFEEAFQDRYGYSIFEYAENLDEHPDVRYDYRKLISEYVLEEFYKPFTEVCRNLGAFSRVQCHGAPTDLLAAYGCVDVPETEALLFEPYFAKIAASASALTGKKIVSCETFTCIYGWKPRPGPAPYIKNEQTADMKLLADSLFANGVNHIVWHGMPFNPRNGNNEFYATVHVGPDSAFADEIPAFNAYMEKVSSIMRRGKVFSDIAVLMPIEDMQMANELPVGNYSPDAKYLWEFRYLKMPDELYGFHPLWISGVYLKDAKVENGKLVTGDAEFDLLYIDSLWLDEQNLTDIFRLANSGLPICIKQNPSQPGKNKTISYVKKLTELLSLPNVTSDFRLVFKRAPIVDFKTESIPHERIDFWCRVDGDSLLIFFANPKSSEITYPMPYGFSFTTETVSIPVKINFGDIAIETTLIFEPYQSVLLEILSDSSVENHSIRFEPKTPAID